MSLTQSLNSALSGLAVSQAALSVTANNIANANTPGYSRQVLDQSALILQGQTSGAVIEDVSRRVDVYLERSIQRETNNVGLAEEISDYYERVQILLGEPGSSNSIDEYIQSYFNALQDLAESPDSTSFKAATVDTAETLAREVSSLAEGLEDLRYQADQDIDELINDINAELEHLDSINLALNRANALGNSTAALLDERDNTIESISEKIDISTYFEEGGAVNIFTANGVGLLEQNANRISYVPASGIDDFIENTAVNPITVDILDDDGNPRLSQTIVEGGVEGGVVSRIDGGRLEGLRQLRDELLPDILAQLDELAANLRDSVNAIHNDGSGFPPATELNGTRLVRANELFDWTGSTQITILTEDGAPVPSPYDDESHTGLRPLNLDFDRLSAGRGDGIVTAETIINEINNYFNAPPVKATLGNLNNIQLASNTNSLPSGSPTSFSFDLDIENISAFGSEIFVSDVVITDDTGATIASQATGEVTNTIPALSVSSFNFTAGSSAVTVNTADTHNLQVGDYVFLQDPGGGPYGGSINAAQLNGLVQITAVGSDNSFEFNVTTNATATATGVAPTNTISALPEYHELEAGEKSRTTQDGTFTANLSASPLSDFYDITVTVHNNDLDPDNNQLTSGTVTYRVYNNENSLLNDRYDVRSTSGAVEREFPSTPHQYITAMLVDENGEELPRTDGSYGNQSGYLQLVSNPLSPGADYGISIDEGDSQQQGQLTLGNPAKEGTGRGFSHYFELNNFFVSNEPNETGDTTTGSAFFLEVEERILDNPSLITTGEVELSNQPVDPDAPPLYTFERYIGNNSVIQRIADVANTQINFDEAGGLPPSTQTIGNYTGELLGFVATKTSTARATLIDANTLLEGLVSRADAVSGVNLDEELANTQLYQAAFNASARVISVTNELFDSLLSAFN